jgi:hypothetical protein
MVTLHGFWREESFRVWNILQGISRRGWMPVFHSICQPNWWSRTFSQTCSTCKVNHVRNVLALSHLSFWKFFVLTRSMVQTWANASVIKIIFWIKAYGFITIFQTSIFVNVCYQCTWQKSRKRVTMGNILCKKLTSFMLWITLFNKTAHSFHFGEKLWVGSPKLSLDHNNYDSWTISLCWTQVLNN